MTFLALDIGNTRLKWAQYASPRPDALLLAQGAEFLENIDKLSEGAWLDLKAPRHILGCVVAADAVKRRLQEQMELWDVSPQWIVASEAEAGLRMLSQGAPRPMVVVMVGTAVTVEALDASGKFLGGLILPGHGIMLRALESGTAGLHVPTGEVREFPTNTSDALTSGGTYAIAGAVERMVQHVRAHCGAEPLCVMTGGAGWKMAPSMSLPFELVDNLIFDGLLQLAAVRFPA